VSRAVLALLSVLAACSVSSDVSREIGARCDDQDECDERCLTGQRFPGGMCSLGCDAEEDCPSGSSCVNVAGGSCLYSCREDPGCEFLGEQWTCQLERERGGEPDSMVTVCVGGP
jgi:hypothetical protein